MFPLPFLTLVAQQQRRFICAEIKPISFTGFVIVVPREDGSLSASPECRKMHLGMTKLRLHAVSNAMRRRWLVRPAHQAPRFRNFRRIDQLASSLTNASSGWTTWPELTAGHGLPKSGDLQEISNSGCVAEFSIAFAWRAFDTLTVGYGASPHVNSGRVSFPVPWGTRQKPRRSALPVAPLSTLCASWRRWLREAGPRSTVRALSGPQTVALENCLVRPVCT